MRKVLVGLFVLCAVFAYGQNPVSLDQAVADGARYLTGRFPKGTRAAVIAIKAENSEIGEFAYSKLGSALVNGNWFTVVERGASALESIEREMGRHLNFYVSEETELSIGKQLGAEIIISGSFARSGGNWRLELQAIRIETTEKSGQWSCDVRADASWASLASPRSASISFSGDSLEDRSRQTVIAGLRTAMQTHRTTLDLDENAAAGAGYGFALTVYITRTPANPSLFTAEVSVAFSQGNRVLCQTGPYHITETSEALIVRRISERLSGDQAFFNRVNAAVSN
jgi:hypothetical protein